jgi:hypothetical protein
MSHDPQSPSDAADFYDDGPDGGDRAMRDLFYLAMGTRIRIDSPNTGHHGSEGVIIGRYDGTRLYNIKLDLVLWWGEDITAERPYTVVNLYPANFVVLQEAANAP